jgi:VanZ family protein
MSETPKTYSFTGAQLPAILWAIFIFILSSIPASGFPSLPFPVPDKLVHAVLFFVLCFLVYRALRNQTRFPKLSLHSLSISLVFTASYGALDEFHQLFVPGREADVYDFLADFVGGCICAVALFVVHRRHRALLP